MLKIKLSSLFKKATSSTIDGMKVDYLYPDVPEGFVFVIPRQSGQDENGFFFEDKLVEVDDLGYTQAPCCLDPSGDYDPENIETGLGGYASVVGQIIPMKFKIKH